MSTLSVWCFDTSEGAGNAVRPLGELSQQKLITVPDAATVAWQPGTKTPKTRQLQDLTGGAFWAMPFGLLLLVPLLGAAIGPAAGALTRRAHRRRDRRRLHHARAGGDHPALRGCSSSPPSPFADGSRRRSPNWPPCRRPQWEART